MQKITENVQRFAAVGQTSFLSMGGVAPWWRSVCTLVTFPFKVISSMVSEVNSSIASYKVPCWDRRESRLSFMGTITCTRRSQCNATLLPTILSLGLLSWFVFSYYLWSSGCLITSNKKHMLKLPQTFTLLTYLSYDSVMWIAAMSVTKVPNEITATKWDKLEQLSGCTTILTLAVTVVAVLEIFCLSEDKW